jgi:GT2 family glycosyltransferase
VVDNASNDGTVEELIRDYPNVTVIANADNAGFPAANNQALRVARSRNILLLNPDTVVTPGAIDALLQFLRASPPDKIVGLRLRNVDGSFQPTVRGTLPTAVEFVGAQLGLPALLRAQSRSEPRSDYDSVTTVQRVGSVSGAALATTRAVIERIGPLDESMFWAEDLDFCYRAAVAGIPVFYLPSAVVVHYGGESGKKNFRRMIYAQHSSRIAFARKHYGRRVELGLRSAFAVMLPVKMAVRALQMMAPQRREENAQRLQGYWFALRECFSGAPTMSKST